MDSLPIELVESILADPKLSIRDVVNFGATSTQFRALVGGSSHIWKAKYLQAWPDFHLLFERDFLEWFAEVRYVYNLRKLTHLLLSSMPARFYRKTDLSHSDLTEWEVLMGDHPRAYHYIMADLTEIIRNEAQIHSVKVVPVDTPGNKTLKYYAHKVLRHLRQQRLADEWREFINLPPDEQLLEKGATFVAQWSQPHIEIEWDVIAAQFDQLTAEAREVLRASNPRHPLFRIPRATTDRWKTHILDENQFGVQHCKEILHAIFTALYEQHNYRGNQSGYYMPSNSFINKVLENKHGLPITLSVVFESIARRMGLRCEPISFPAHFLLRFSEGRSEQPGDSYYIDVYNNGNCIRKGTCPHTQLHSNNHRELGCATARQVVERMANNLEMASRQYAQPAGRMTLLRSALELLQLVNPSDISNLVNLSRLYMSQEMDVTPLANFILDRGMEMTEGMLNRIVTMLKDYQTVYAQKVHNPSIVVKRRADAPNVKFAVGMVVRHVPLSYFCVIYDWDAFCMASREWKMQMCVHKLKYQDQQPFYNVLDNGGSPRYVAQENLAPVTAHSLEEESEDLGKHFSHFFETHYVPNAEKEKEYPDDAAVRYYYHQKLKEEE